MYSPNNSSSQKNKEHKSIKRKSMKNTKVGRRFSYEQVKSLESIFKVETKLDPRKKVEVAAELGLDPHQVAIWFQNKRARWRSKQMEQEYKELQENYDSLYMKCDHLESEKRSLLMQLNDLNSLVKNGDDVDLANEENEFKESSNGGIDNDEEDDRDNITTRESEKTEEQKLVSCNEEEESIMTQLASPDQKWCDFSCWWES